MRLSANFTLAELTVSDTARRLGLNNEPDAATVDKLILLADRMEKVRELLGGNPIIVTSGYRSPAVNKAVGGVPDSDHIDAVAVDFKCPGYGSPFLICARIADSKLKYDQIIHEKRQWVHISFGPKMRNQLLTLPRGSRTYLKGLHV